MLTQQNQSTFHKCKLIKICSNADTIQNFIDYNTHWILTYTEKEKEKKKKNMNKCQMQNEFPIHPNRI